MSSFYRVKRSLYSGNSMRNSWFWSFLLDPPQLRNKCCFKVFFSEVLIDPWARNWSWVTGVTTSLLHGSLFPTLGATSNKINFPLSFCRSQPSSYPFPSKHWFCLFFFFFFLVLFFPHLYPVLFLFLGGRHRDTICLRKSPFPHFFPFWLLLSANPRGNLPAMCCASRQALERNSISSPDQFGC